MMVIISQESAFPFLWEQTEAFSDSWTCKHCATNYRGRRSGARVKDHLCHCPYVPANIRSHAETLNLPTKRGRDDATSSGVEAVVSASTSHLRREHTLLLPGVDNSQALMPVPLQASSFGQHATGASHVFGHGQPTGTSPAIDFSTFLSYSPLTSPLLGPSSPVMLSAGAFSLGLRSMFGGSSGFSLLPGSPPHTSTSMLVSVGTSMQMGNPAVAASFGGNYSGFAPPQSSAPVFFNVGTSAASFGGNYSSFAPIPTAPSQSSAFASSSLQSQRVSEECVAESFLRLSMCHCDSSISQITNGLSWKEFSEWLQQNNMPIRLSKGDQYLLQRSMVNIREALDLFKLELEESWKASGCTLLVYNAYEIMGNVSAAQEHKCLIGIYGPKGMLFVETLDEVDIGDALNPYFPSFDFDCVRDVIHHQQCHGISAHRSIVQKIWGSGDDFQRCSSSCLRLVIQRLCAEICNGSEWARSLIEKAGKILECLFKLHLCKWFYNTLNKKGFKEFACGRDSSSPILSFLEILMVEDELKSHLKTRIHLEESVEARGQLREILSDHEFWGEGRELKRVLTHVLKILELLDTLVPTAGYLQLAIDKVVHTLCNDATRGMPNDSIWPGLAQLNRACGVEKRAAAHLNPVYFMEKGNFGDEALTTLLHIAREEEEKVQVAKELELYHEHCSQVFGGKDEHHPVQMWKLYGDAFPVLKKYAIMILSQPVSCMCDILNKHKIGGDGDDYIMKLNLRMKEEFRILGDGIYKPISLNRL